MVIFKFEAQPKGIFHGPLHSENDPQNTLGVANTGIGFAPSDSALTDSLK